MPSETCLHEEIKSFSVTTPFPKNPRLLSFRGAIPHCTSPEYEQFEKFLWNLWNLDQKTAALITLLISSTGGSAESIFLYYEFIKTLRSPIRTVAMGGAHSAAALILALGAKDSRFVMPSTKIALHCPRVENPTETPSSFMSRIWPRNRPSREQRMADTYTQTYASILLECTDGKILNMLGEWQDETSQEEKIRGVFNVLDEDIMLSAEDAVEYGLADHIVSPQILREILHD